MTTKKIISNQTDEGIYEIILSNGVGGWDSGFTGPQIAAEIRRLNSQGATKIIERINSPGGSVLDAYDIVDANLNSTAIIETIVVGLAGSAAGWIAATGTKGHRLISDYGLGMIHEPTMGGETIEKTKDEKVRKALQAIKDSIIKIFVNMTGRSEDEINSEMTAETWYNASEWVSKGFADKVVETGIKPETSEDMTPAEMMNIFNQIEQNKSFINQNKKKMKTVAAHLKLNENATAEEVVSAITQVENKAVTAETKVTELNTALTESQNKVNDLTTENTTLKEKIHGYEAAEVAARKEKVAVVIDKAIEQKKINKDQRQLFLDMFGEDHEKAQKAMDAISTPAANIIELINKGLEKLIPADRKDWTYRDWEKKDPEGLLKLKQEASELVKEMYRKEYGTEMSE